MPNSQRNGQSQNSANNMQASANTMQNSQNTQQNTQNAQMNTANMQPKAVVGIFRDLNAAQQAVSQLRSSGFTTEEINLVSKHTNDSAMEDDSIMDGTMTGGAIGGIGGLMLSAGALTIPGLGPIIAAGPLAATIAGAIGGGITGGLVDWGIPSDKSEEYNEQVSSGNTLAVIKTPQNKVAQAVQVLTAGGAMNIETHNIKA